MNWAEVTWIAMSAASLTLGLIHLFVWFKRRGPHGIVGLVHKLRGKGESA